MNDIINTFIDKNEECVLSTIGYESRNPEGATVGFSVQENYRIVFGTYKESRKYKNLIKDNRIAVTIGFSGAETIQYQGRARILSGKEVGNRLEQHFKKLPEAKKYKDLLNQVYFVIEPDWIRYTNIHDDPWTVQELDLNISK